MGKVEVIQIFEDKGNGNVKVVGQPVAIIANGVPIYLKENFVSEKNYLEKELFNNRYNDYLTPPQKDL